MSAKRQPSSKKPPIQISGRSIGPGHPCFIIAEAGVNHNGQRELALELVDAAAAAGADAVKFQTFKADRLAAAAAPRAAYQAVATGGQESQRDMLRRLELSREQHEEIKARCRQKGILFLSTPFEEESADLLVELGLPALKIPSGEITNLIFLDYVARKKLPLIVSTGMATLEEVRQAVNVIHRTGNHRLILLHCVSNYPARPDQANLRAMETLRKAFKVPVGFSDHTLGLTVSLAAVALGACVIEKHFTIDRDMPGPDHAASLEPQELTSLVKEIRAVEFSLGSGEKEPTPEEAATAAVARKSWVAAVDIPAGSLLRRDMLILQRPGTGVPPAALDQLLKRRAAQAISAGVLLHWDMLA